MSPNSHVCSTGTTDTVPASGLPKHLNQARQLLVPSREMTLRRDPYVHYFWNRHRNLLEKAWQEWE